MRGGAMLMEPNIGVLADGSDGCVFTKPSLPCAEGTQGQTTIDPRNPEIVGKVVDVSDEEKKFLEIANSILGKELALKYLAGLQGSCNPANSTHPPKEDEKPLFNSSIKSLSQWSSRHACSKLKEKYLTRKNITSTHSLLFISRYPRTLEEWITSIKVNKLSIPSILQSVNQSMPDFIHVLQLFYKDPSKQLINLDLHHANIFVRTYENSIQFGLSDFGRCISVEGDMDSAIRLYLTKYQKQTIFSRFRQIPFEARLLNFIFKQNLETQSPSVILHSFITNNDISVYSSYSNDFIIMNLQSLFNYLQKKVLFIEFIETLKSIVIKMKGQQLLELTSIEKQIVWFILTRYMAVAPIITIAEQLMDLNNRNQIHEYAKRVCNEYLEGKVSSHNSLYYPILSFLTRILVAPYVTSLKSVEDADNVHFWNDIMSGM
jgi:hypothetical protein